MAEEQKQYCVLVEKKNDLYDPNVWLLREFDDAVKMAVARIQEQEKDVTVGEMQDYIKNLNSVGMRCETKFARYNIFKEAVIDVDTAAKAVGERLMSITHDKDPEWSQQEKDVLCEIVRETDPLEFPIQKVRVGNGTYEQMYVIRPDDMTDELIAKLWPFLNPPKATDTLYDVHEEAEVTLNKCHVIRYNNRNLLVSQYYTKSGGMAVDLMYKEDQKQLRLQMSICKDAEDKENQTTCTTIKCQTPNDVAKAVKDVLRKHGLIKED